MASNLTKSLEADLKKALEAGNMNVAPSALVNGGALQREDLSGVMEIVCAEDKLIKLQKRITSKPATSMMYSYNRQTSVGLGFGGTAQFEGQVGVEEDGTYFRMTVPMAFYSLISRVTMQANMVDTFDGVKAEDRVAKNAASKIAQDIEIDLFRGKADYVNAGVFDGNPLAIPNTPGMLGLDPQVRMSDSQRNAQDLMFAEYGGNETVVIPGGSVMTQDNVEDAAIRSVMNHGSADSLFISPKALSLYNKITHGKERVILSGGSVTSSTGANLKEQETSAGTMKFETSRYLTAKAAPAAPRSVSPLAPTHALLAAGNTTSFTAGTYFYFVTSVNERGESVGSTASSVVVAAGDQVSVTITPPGSGTVRYFNVYRTFAGQPAVLARFIGRVANSGAATTVFLDLNNRSPGHSTAFLVDDSSMEIRELAPFGRVKLGISDLSIPEAHFRFACLAVRAPRKNCLIDNVRDFQ
jgi:hypothetical protein